MKNSGNAIATAINKFSFSEKKIVDGKPKASAKKVLPLAMKYEWRSPNKENLIGDFRMPELLRNSEHNVSRKSVFILKL